MLQPAGRHPQTRIYSCPDGVQKRYSNVVGMAVCPRDDFLLPPGQITRPLCAPRQASPSGNVLPVSVIPLRPPFARRREKPPDRIRPLPEDFRLPSLSLQYAQYLSLAPCASGADIGIPQAWQNLSCCVIERSSCRLVVY